MKRSGLRSGFGAALLAGTAIWACDGGSSVVTPGPEDASPVSSIQASSEAGPPGRGAEDSATPDTGADVGAVPDAPDAPPGVADAALPEPLCLRSPTEPCLARLDLGIGKLPYYRSHPLDRPHPAILELVLVQHGNSRNAWDYYDTMSGLATIEAPAQTAVLAPHFQILGDLPPSGDLYWYNDDWKAGLAARNGATESYAALDALLVAAKSAFPNLKRVTIVGYSAGGQTIQRYAAGNGEHDRTPAIATRYVVGSPGSYMYLDERRLRPDVACSDAPSCAATATSFEVPSYAPGCESADPRTVAGGGGYDDYKFGLVNRVGYLARVSDAALKAKYVARKVVYLLGAGDSDSSSGTAYSVLDRECPAMVQGPLNSSFRLQRGLVYHRYITLLFAAAHRVSVIPVCKHDEACVFASPAAKLEIFGP